jgi:hypothetical protein
MARRTVSGPLTRRKVPKRALRAVTPEDPYGLAKVSRRDMLAELERRGGTVNTRGKSKQYRETPKLVAAIVRMVKATGKRVGPGMDIASLDQLASLRDEVERITGEAARELTRRNRPHNHEPDEPCIRGGDSPCTGDSPGRVRYSWADVSRALGFSTKQVAHDRYANPSGPRKRDGNPNRPRRKR